MLVNTYSYLHVTNKDIKNVNIFHTQEKNRFNVKTLFKKSMENKSNNVME